MNPTANTIIIISLDCPISIAKAYDPVSGGIVTYPYRIIISGIVECLRHKARRVGKIEHGCIVALFFDNAHVLLHDRYFSHI